MLRKHHRGIVMSREENVEKVRIIDGGFSIFDFRRWYCLLLMEMMNVTLIANEEILVQT